MASEHSPARCVKQRSCKAEEKFQFPFGRTRALPNGIDSNLLKLPVRRSARTEILCSLQYSRQQRLYDRIHTSTMLKYHGDSSKGRRTPVPCQIHSPKALRHGTLRRLYARLSLRPEKPADAPRSSRRGANGGEQTKKRKTAAELTSVDPFCVAAGGRPRTGCGGGEEFLHQHDCATPESAASAANRR